MSAIPPKQAESQLTSFGIADTMSVWNNRIQLTVGVRQQYVEYGFVQHRHRCEDQRL